MPPLLDETGVDCANCKSELKTPYIICAVCNVNICTVCFSKGAEFRKHENNHDYSIVNDSILLFNNCQWTAKEELTLLDSLLKNQNFTLAKRVLPQYSEKEIKEHYDNYYLQKNGHDLIPTFSTVVKPELDVQITQYTITLNNSDDPPRYSPNSIGYQTLSGYNPIRGDFEVEYDYAAEDMLNNLTFQSDLNDPDYKLITNLQYAIVEKYNTRLKERQRRKEVVRNHGLICPRKMHSWLTRYDTTITSKVCDELIRFAQFYSGEDFEKFMEGFHCAGELKAKIARYCDYHRMGIKTKRGIQFYLKLKARRENGFAEVQAFRNLLPINVKLTKHLVQSEGMVKKRGGYTPLEVEGLPGYDKLTPKEQNLCRTVRLVPLSYLEFRDMLVSENHKNGNIRLQTARKLLKIDVNKTRRLYDFLVQEGYINIKK